MSPDRMRQEATDGAQDHLPPLDRDRWFDKAREALAARGPAHRLEAETPYRERRAATIERGRRLLAEGDE